MMCLFLQGRAADTATIPSWRKSLWRTHFNRRSSPLHDKFECELNFAMSFCPHRAQARVSHGAAKNLNPSKAIQ